MWLIGTSQLVAQPRTAAIAPRVVAIARGAEQLGRPALSGQTLVFHRAGRGGSQIRLLDLGTGQERVLRSQRRALLLNPSFDGRELLYVRSTSTRQELRLGPPARRAPSRDRRLYGTTPTGRRDAGHGPGRPATAWATRAASRPGSRRGRLPGVSTTLWTHGARAGDRVRDAAPAARGTTTTHGGGAERPAVGLGRPRLGGANAKAAG